MGSQRSPYEVPRHLPHLARSSGMGARSTQMRRASSRRAAGSSSGTSAPDGAHCSAPPADLGDARGCRPSAPSGVT
eukprot:4124997-Pyramimonas_sp.AAC.1